MFKKSKMFTSKKMSPAAEGPTGQHWTIDWGSKDLSGDVYVNANRMVKVGDDRYVVRTVPNKRSGIEVRERREDYVYYIDHDKNLEIRENSRGGVVKKEILNLITGERTAEIHPDLRGMQDRMTYGYGIAGSGGGGSAQQQQNRAIRPGMYNYF